MVGMGGGSVCLFVTSCSLPIMSIRVVCMFFLRCARVVVSLCVSVHVIVCFCAHECLQTLLKTRLNGLGRGEDLDLGSSCLLRTTFAVWHNFCYKEAHVPLGRKAG